jgi:hypothetical protein
MKYIIIELQRFADGTVGVPPVNTADDFLNAKSVFHTKCGVAAISSVPVHSVVLLTEAGQTMAYESFNHEDTNA